MRNSIIGLTLCLSFCATAKAVTDDRAELNTVTCLHFPGQDRDADITVTFEYIGDDSAKVNVEERFVSQYTGDQRWVNILSGDFQVASSSMKFAIDDVEGGGGSIVIQRPIPVIPHGKGTNATFDLQNGTVLNMLCEKTPPAL